MPDERPNVLELCERLYRREATPEDLGLAARLLRTADRAAHKLWTGLARRELEPRDEYERFIEEFGAAPPADGGG